MKKIIIILILVLTGISDYSFSANELFRSRVSGSWTTPNTWEFSTDGGSVWITSTILFPVLTSGATTIRNPHTVAINPTTSLAIDQFTIDGGGILFINTGSRLTISGAGTQLLLAGTISGIGAIKTSGAPTFDIRNGSSFQAPLVLDSGDVTIVNPNGPFIADISGAISISSGRILNINGGGYGVRAFSNVTNNGTISGGGSTFIMRGSSFINNGIINSSDFNFDSTTTVNGPGVWGSSNININSTGNVTLSDTVVFGSSNVVNVNVNNGGRINGAAQYLLLNGSANQVNMFVNTNGTVGNASTTNVHTRGAVVIFIRNGGIFNATLNVKTGTTTSFNDNGPFIAVYSGPIIIDAAATLAVNSGGYTILARSSVVNNGTISGGGSAFTTRGATFTNNSIINVATFNFDSTTALSGTGLWSGPTVNINSSGNVLAANNLSFGSANVLNFNINSGGRLNPNTRTVTFNGTGNTVTVNVNANGTAVNSGIVQTQGSVVMNLRNGSNFNSPLKVNTGQTTGYNDNSPFIGNLYNTLTVDSEGTFTVLGGGYTVQANNNVTNNGIINSPGSTFTMTGNIFANNGTVSPTNFNFDDTTSVSGTGVWNPQNLNINSNAIVSLSNNVSFGGTGVLTFNILSNGFLNPNTFIATLKGTSNTVNFNMNNLGTTVNSGILQTQGAVNLNLRNGARFLTPFKANTGTANFLNDNSPFDAVVNSTITIDAGAALNVNSSGYILTANENVTNNGTISGGGSSFHFFSQNFTNNGVVNVSNFVFKGILVSPTYSHTLSGTGNFTTPNCIVEDGSYVSMSTDHQFSYLTINNGATFDINGKTLRLFGAGIPIAVNGFLLTAGTIEYNGTAPQTIVNTNIEYQNLRINDSAGVTCSENFTIPGTLQIVKGDLNLNGKVINLSTTGLLSETPGNTVTGATGYLMTLRNINAPSALNVAGLGASITTAANLGLTEIRRGHGTHILPSGGQSIRRYYTIKPITNTNLNATMIFRYDESELNGNTEANLFLFKSTNTGVNYFFDGGTVAPASNQITLNNINSFARYTAGSGVGTINLTASIEGLLNVATSRLNNRDTIFVQLRNTSSPFSVVDSAKGVLDSITLTANLRFSVAATDTYYVVVKSRNTIETWSRTAAVIYNSNGSVNYNFTTAATQAFGNNMILLGTKWSIYTGDVNQDGAVDLADLALIDNDAGNFVSGYVVTDLNADYVVDIADAALADNNAFLFVTKVTP